jgi:Tol biopolymer transport system component/DNA-binding winged helix-turn-helix (wHTH) protein
MGFELPPAHVYRFGLFEADARNGRLLRHGERVKIQDQPFRVLLVFLGRAGEIVTREELRQKIWPSDTYVEFDGSLNAALKRLRYTLGDSADNPTFIETVPKRGYRFIAPVERVYPHQAATEAPAATRLKSDFAVRKSESAEDSRHTARKDMASGLSLAAKPAAVPPEPVLLPFPAPKQPVPRSRATPLIAAISILALVSAGIYLLFPVRPPRVLQSVQLTHLGRVEYARGMVTDGARIYFSEVNGGHYTVDQVSVTGGETTPVPLPFPNAEVFDISPDHTELLVASFTGLEQEEPLWIVPVTGGAPHRLGDVRAASAAWSPDGQSIAYGYSQDSGLYMVNRDGSGARRLVAMPAPGQLTSVRWSPSGRVLRFTMVNDRSRPVVSQWEIRVDGSGLHSLLAGGDGYGSWTPDGKYFVYRSTDDERGLASIWAIREGAGIFGSFRRKPAELFEGPQFFFAPLASADGKRVFFIGDQERRELVRYDSASRQFVPYLSGIFARDISFSKDGQQLVYTHSPDVEVWLSKADGSDRRPLTFSPMRAGGARWSPDGRQIAFVALTTSAPGGQSGIYLLPTEAGGKPEQVVAMKGGGLVGWHPNGRSLVFWEGSETGPGPKLALYLVDTKTRQVSLLPGSEGLHHGALSPDGLRVAALTDSNHSVVIFDLQTSRQIELAKGAVLSYPYWAHDGKAVFFQDVFQGSEQPIYRVRTDDRRVERVTNFAQPFASDVAGYRLTGITPNDSPLASLIRSNSDLYALDVDFP